MNTIKDTPFLFAESRHNLPGAGFILSTRDPFEIGRVLVFKNHDEFLSATANSIFPFAVIPGYRVVIQFDGSMAKGSRIEVNDETHARIQKLLERMAGYFYKEKISLHSGYYKKYSLLSNRIDF